MQQFQPGDEVYVRLVFQSVVSIKNAFIVFVHEQDEDHHIVIRTGERKEDVPLLKPAIQTALDFSKMIERDQKPGVYTLDKINFESFGGIPMDYRGDVGTPKFVVIPEREFAPIVENVSIFTESMWRIVKDAEQDR